MENTESFEEYKKRLQDIIKYRYQGIDIVIFLLWEILEILWQNGKH